MSLSVIIMTTITFLTICIIFLVVFFFGGGALNKLNTFLGYGIDCQPISVNMQMNEKKWPRLPLNRLFQALPIMMSKYLFIYTQILGKKIRTLGYE